MVKKIKWNENLSVNHETIDQQHQKLIDLTNDIIDLLEDAKNGLDTYDEIIAIINELIDYTEYHFEKEEEIFDTKDYISQKAHKFEHKLFVAKLHNIDLSHVDRDQVEFIENLMEDVLNWIQNHILEMDQTYVEILSDQKKS